MKRGNVYNRGPRRVQERVYRGILDLLVSSRSEIEQRQLKNGRVEKKRCCLTIPIEYEP